MHLVNNTRGHKAGDLMLCAVATTVRKMFGKSHTYRIGGDEFVAFATDTTAEALSQKTADMMA